MYDYTKFKTTYPAAEAHFSKSLIAKSFTFMQCLSMDGVNLVVAYVNPKDEDEVANLEFNTLTGNCKFSIDRD
jgi:hypothetical protein